MMPSINLEIDAGGIPQVNSYLNIHVQNKTESVAHEKQISQEMVVPACVPQTDQ